MAILWLLPFLVGVAMAQHDAHTMYDRQTMVHLFEWKWNDIAAECENWLSPHGFAGVQISPPNNHIVLPNNGWPWWERYQPIDYTLYSRSGTPQQFADMVRRCNNVGVRIYVDTVINHMTAASGPGGGGPYDFNGVPYSALDFNFPQNKCPTPGGIDYGNVYSIRNCDLSGLKDLDLSKNYVRGKIADYLNSMIDLGVAGFRVDASKHMWPGDLQNIYSRLRNLNTNFGFPSGARAFIFHEVIDMGGGEAIQASEYVHLGRVTEFRYGKELSAGFLGNNQLKYFYNFGKAWGLLDEYNAVVFVDNHDNQRGHGGAGEILTYKDAKKYKMANAFMLAHPYGIARVMSSYAFSNTDQSPPKDGNGNTISPIFYSDNSCGNGWICEHRWRQIKNMVNFRNVVVGQPLSNWWDNGNHQIAFGRGNRGFLVINNEGGNLSRTLQTGLPAGSYCNVILSDFVNNRCTGQTIQVNGSGYASFNIAGSGSDPVVAIHVNARQ